MPVLLSTAQSRGGAYPFWGTSVDDEGGVG
jgi:hypothetical protein